jgi:hypothetical protein
MYYAITFIQYVIKCKGDTVYNLSIYYWFNLTEQEACIMYVRTTNAQHLNDHDHLIISLLSFVNELYPSAEIDTVKLCKKER